jgi:hypothetical protein
MGKPSGDEAFAAASDGVRASSALPKVYGTKVQLSPKRGLCKVQRPQGRQLWRFFVQQSRDRESTMNRHWLLISAIASLALFAAYPASALTPVWNAGVENSTSNIVPARMSKWFYKCNTNFEDNHARQRCYQMHGLNSQGHHVKSGM